MNPIRGLQLLIALLAGCATVGNARDLAGTNWKVTGINGHPASGSISFGSNRFGGDFGCNRVQGTYRLEGNVFKASSINMSQMACVSLEPAEHPSPMDLEQAAIAVLGSEPHPIWSGTNSLILRGSGGEIVLVRDGPTDAPRP